MVIRLPFWTLPSFWPSTFLSSVIPPPRGNVSRQRGGMAQSLKNILPPSLKKLIPPSTVAQISNQPRNLYQTLSRLPKDGVGSRVFQTRWQSKGIEGCFWEITRVSLKMEGTHGKAWGKLVWRGESHKRLF